MSTSAVFAAALLALLLIQSHCANTVFNLNDNRMSGSSIYNTVCNVQTTLQFNFNSNSLFNDTSTASYTSMKFLDVSGSDLGLTLTNYALDSSTKSIVTGYNINAAYYSIFAAYIFQFTSGSNNVYLWIPITLSSAPSNNSFNSVDVVDLTSNTAPGNNLAYFTNTSSLSAFNFFDLTDYNQWYTTVIGTNTLLVSKFIYRVGTYATVTSSSTAATNLLNLNISSAQSGSYGNKLCYASTDTTQNFQTHLRQSVPLWFIYIFIFIYWLIYLFSDSTTIKVYDKTFQNNKWTGWSLYSLYHLAHQQFFTRLSRLTILLINWSIQGVFIASIYGNQYTLGSAMIIWTAVVAFVATIPFPFIFGAIFHRNIYENFQIKYENIRSMIGIIDREKLQPFEKEVDNCEQRLYGYFHWYNCIAFAIFFICWPLAINQMQKLPRTYYYVHWYWLASQGIVFALQHFIYQPLLVWLLGHTRLVQIRGGFYYDIKLGQAQRIAAAN